MAEERGDWIQEDDQKNMTSDTAWLQQMGSSKNTLNTTLRKMNHLDKLIVFNVLIILMILLVSLVIFRVKSWNGPIFLRVFLDSLVSR
jgi:putative ribosome biogenesis GTPase RsgA